jgi:hypothetical protein
MIFRVTAKAKEQLGLNTLSSIDSNISSDFFFSWYVNVVYINHKKYFHLTESKTLFSIFIHAKGVNTTATFEKMVGKLFADILNDIIEGLNLNSLELSNCMYTKTENNNVRRAQIDHLYHAKHLVEDGMNTFDVNRYPIASIGFKMPVDYFIEELGEILKKDGAVFVNDHLLN